MSTKSASLSASDRKLLSAALNFGLALEKSLAQEHVSAASPDILASETSFREALRACAGGESALITKLSELAPKVSVKLGASHLMGLLVPLERLAGRSARDEEFLFSERDGNLQNEEDIEASLPSSPISKSSARIVLCENIRSAFNVGAVFRTIETFGGSEVWMSGYTPDPLKTAMGADALIRSRKFDRSSDALREAKTTGFTIVALENSPGAVQIENFNWPEKTLLVLGNERFGVDSQTLAECDHVVRISTLGLKNSLNVGIAFGVAASMWHRTPESPHAGLTTSMSRAHGETITPIGFVRGGFADTQVAPRQGSYAHATASVELESRFEGRPSNFEQALKDLEGFERAWLIFGFHESEGWLPQVRPPRGDGSKRGLFATRAPHRPNRLGISCVRILRVDETKRRIEISEHDLLEGTPIYDIKPYVAGADAFPDAKGGWVDEIEKSAFRFSLEEGVEEKLRWFEAQDEKRIQFFIDEQLRFQPLDTDRKRLELSGSGETARIGTHHTIAFRTWRIDFKITERNSTGGGEIMILNIRSSYSEKDLKDDQDPYNDKGLHRLFKTQFA